MFVIGEGGFFFEISIFLGRWVVEFLCVFRLGRSLGSLGRRFFVGVGFEVCRLFVVFVLGVFEFVENVVIFV